MPTKLCLALLCLIAALDVMESTEGEVQTRASVHTGVGQALELFESLLQQLPEREQQSFWPNLRMAMKTPARRLQSDSAESLTKCLEKVPPPSLVNGYMLKLEHASGEGLGMLVANVAKILLEEVVGFRVELKQYRDEGKQLERLRRGVVDINLQVPLVIKADFDDFKLAVEEEDLVVDLGDIGFPELPGWYSTQAASETDCTAADYWLSFKNPELLADMLTVQEVPAAVDANGTYLCTNDPPNSFCLHPGKYFGSACDANGYSRANNTRPCRALLASHPTVSRGIVEQLLNNLQLEFGIVYLGDRATEEIITRAHAGEKFLFFDKEPSYLTSTELFVRVKLPNHNAKQWIYTPGAVTDQGNISTDYTSTPPIKLGNANTLGEHPHLGQFCNQFEFERLRVDEMLELLHQRVLGTFQSNPQDASSADFSHCSDSIEGNCAEMYADTACVWLKSNSQLWPEFIPKHAHCGAGQKVNVRGEKGQDIVATCEECDVGTFKSHSSFEKSCDQCPAGTYADELGRKICTACPAGQHGKPINGSTNISAACERCDAGLYQDEDGQLECKSCEAGQYQPAKHSTFCSVCTTGTYQNATGALKCNSCDSTATACSVVNVSISQVKEMCLSGEKSAEKCTCNEGFFSSASGGCLPCPPGAFCCMCKETVACYDDSFGTCNATLLRENIELHNSTCRDKCWSGSNRPIAMPGYFQVPQTSETGDPMFAACNLRLPSVYRRTKVIWDLQGCKGGHENRCSEGSSGYLCRSCDDGMYLTFTGKCVKCSDPAGSRTLQLVLLCVGIFILIPLFFLIFYFSVSDKSSNQMMVYPRIFIDLCTGLYLIYSSLFRYWPSELLHYQFTDGKSRVERLNMLFMSCSFSLFHNNFVGRYYSYLLLPMLLFIGVFVQVGFVYLLYKNNPLREDEDKPHAVSDHGELDTGMSDADDEKKSGCFRSIASKMPDVNSPRGARFAWSAPDSKASWSNFVDHSRQVFLLWICFIYISVVNYSLTVFDCSESNEHIDVSVKYPYGLQYMEEEATIPCWQWSDPKWRPLAIGFVFASTCYTVLLPTTLAYVFYRNRMKARRGEIGYLRRYGFLLKPYRQKTFYWEIVNIYRKAGLSIVVKFHNMQPFVCGALATVILFFIVANQANMRPYKYAKHNDCAIFVLSVSLLNFFSSMLFVSELPTKEQKQILLYLNVLAVVTAAIWALGGALRDIYTFLRFMLYTVGVEASGHAEEERQIMWETVDSPGIVNLVWYDFLVMRNRYWHKTQREVIIGPSKGATEPTGADAQSIRTRSFFDKQFDIKVIAEDQVQARDTWEKFQKGLAAFIARIDEDAITPDFEDQLGAEAERDRGGAGTGSGSEPEPEPEAEPEPDDFSPDFLRSGSRSLSSSVKKPVRDLQHLKYRARLLGDMYSKSTLVYLVFYLEHALKTGEYKQLELDELSAGDLAGQMVQFFRVFATDANGGSATTDRTKLAQAAGKNDVLGGWHATEDAGTTRSRRSRDPSAPVPVQPDEGEPKDSCSPLYRPFQLVGIDMQQYLDPDGMELRGGHTDGATDFANELGSLQHTLEQNFELASSVGAFGLDSGPSITLRKIEGGAQNPANANGFANTAEQKKEVDI